MLESLKLLIVWKRISEYKNVFLCKNREGVLRVNRSFKEALIVVVYRECRLVLKLGNCSLNDTIKHIFIGGS